MAQPNPIGNLIAIINRITADKPSEIVKDYDFTSAEGIRIAIEDLWDTTMAIAVIFKHQAMMLGVVKVVDTETLQELVQVIDRLTQGAPDEIAAQYDLSSPEGIRQAVGDLYDAGHAIATIAKELSLVMVGIHTGDEFEQTGSDSLPGPGDDPMSDSP